MDSVILSLDRLVPGPQVTPLTPCYLLVTSAQGQQSESELSVFTNQKVAARVSLYLQTIPSLEDQLSQ